MYTDPSGEFLQLAFFGMAFMSDFITNVMHGYGNPGKMAYSNVTNTINGINSCLQFNTNVGNTSASFGLSPFALGFSYSINNNSGSHFSFGFGVLGGPFLSAGANVNIGKFDFGIGVGFGENYKAWGVSATYDGYGAGVYSTYYGEATGP
jgi:hypothetical protein